MYIKNQNSFQSFKETDEKAERTTTECNNNNLYKRLAKYRARKARAEEKALKFKQQEIEKRIKNRFNFSKDELQNEEWRTIKHEGLEDYQVSNLGRIKNKFGKVLQGDIVFSKRKSGLKQIACLQLNYGKGKFVGFHQIVAETFLDNPFNESNFRVVINHKDGNPLNNRVSNLEYCSHAYNIKYGYKNLDEDTKNKKYYDLNSQIQRVYIPIRNNEVQDCFIDGNEIIFPSINRQSKLLNCDWHFIKKYFGETKRISMNQEMYC